MNEEGSGEKHMPLQGKTGSLCFLPARIKYSNWHSTTGCEGSGLNSYVWKATFHPISSQCCVLRVFTVTHLCHFYLYCMSYSLDGICLKLFDYSHHSLIFFNLAALTSVSAFIWFIAFVCMVKNNIHVMLSFTVLQSGLCSASHVSHDILSRENLLVTAAGHWTWHTSRMLMCSEWWGCFQQTGLWSKHHLKNSSAYIQIWSVMVLFIWMSVFIAAPDNLLHWCSKKDWISAHCIVY